jgi:hypothetical protein
MPRTKLIGKCREGAKIIKRYEIPLTPFRRLVESELISVEIKAGLEKIFASLNPAELKRGMMELLDELLDMQICPCS